MGTPQLLSELELYVLLTVLRLADEAYGVGISSEIEQLRGAPVSTSVIYAALDRLSARGLVDTEVGEATPERGGRAKRYFRVTGEGLAVLQQTRSTLNQLWRHLPAAGKEPA